MLTLKLLDFGVFCVHVHVYFSFSGIFTERVRGGIYRYYNLACQILYDYLLLIIHFLNVLDFTDPLDDFEDLTIDLLGLDSNVGVSVKSIQDHFP